MSRWMRIWIGVVSIFILSGVAAMAQVPEFEYQTGGRRDPFIAQTGFSEVKTSKEAQLEMGLEEIILEGVVWDEAGSLAIINGAIVSEGERIGEYLLYKVESDKIVLRKDGRSHIIPIVNQEEP
jgi:Tfp pilus assembly protein PilP